MSSTKTAHANFNLNNNNKMSNNYINNLSNISISNNNNNNSNNCQKKPMLKRQESGEYNYYRFDQSRLPYVVANEGRTAKMEMLPNPPQENLYYDINTYEKNDFVEQEPRWNPEIHLRITEPEYVVRVGTWDKVKCVESVKSRNDGTTDSKLAFTAPFGLLTPEAVEIMRKICFREMDTKAECQTPRGNKRAVRGFWYTSPFIRDMMSCPVHLALLEKLTGEPVVPCFSYSNSPQINISKLGNKGTIDHWHNDSLTYVSVLMLSDMSQVTGGALEVMKCQKHEGLDKLARKEPLDDVLFTVNYDRPGMCILNHGSEVLHHVTPITHNPKNIVRMSVIMAFSSANAYRPTDMVLNTMTFCDGHSKMFGYEHYRYTAWQMMSILKDMAENDKFEKDNDKKYAERLRHVADELTRAAHQLENPHADEIKFYHEDNKHLTVKNHERSFQLTNN